MTIDGKPLATWLCNELTENPADWVQAGGTIILLLAGLISFLVQSARRRADEQKRATELARTAGALASYALNLVIDRLDGALAPRDTPVLFGLRGFRTTETVQAMRELDFTHVPPELVEPFAKVRSAVFAVNRRMTEIFESERAKRTRRGRRRDRLDSCGRVLEQGLSDYERLRTLLSTRHGISLPQVQLPDKVSTFMAEAQSRTSSPPAARD